MDREKSIRSVMEKVEDIILSFLGPLAIVFGYYVTDPECFRVVAFDENGKATSIEEKSKEPEVKLCSDGVVFLSRRS